jgi:hypothetical protein
MEKKTLDLHIFKSMKVQTIQKYITHKIWLGIQKKCELKEKYQNGEFENDSKFFTAINIQNGIIMGLKELGTELGMEQKLNAEIKALEYRKIWDEANKTEKTDFAASWFKEKKTDDKLIQHKKDLTQTKKKIKALKQIIEKDSLERVKIEPITL